MDQVSEVCKEIAQLTDARGVVSHRQILAQKVAVLLISYEGSRFQPTSSQRNGKRVESHPMMIGMDCYFRGRERDHLCETEMASH